jgi:uncharacterized protein
VAAAGSLATYPSEVVESLPLFPLGTVLFPGLVLPLHIFEERYRSLIRTIVDLPDGSPRRFGVVATRAGRDVDAVGARALHDVGCAAELRQVDAYPDGRFDIITVGGTRFHLSDVDRSLPYLQGTVEWLDEPAVDVDPALIGGVTALFANYRNTLLDTQGGDIEEFTELPTDPNVLSYLIAAAMILELNDKQRLLAATDATSRLQIELGLLDQERRLLAVVPSLPAVDLAQTVLSPN